LANVEDAGPDTGLRALARRIDPDTRRQMTPTELRLRCEFVSGLLSEAGTGDSDADGRKLRRGAERYLKAMSMSAYLVFAAAITREINAKQAAGDMDAVNRLGGELTELTRKHPQVVFDCADSDERAVLAVLGELSPPNDSNPAARKPRWWWQFLRRKR
jgi:hypothetical protein